MSTDYRLETEIPMSDLFDGRMEKYYIREHINDKSSEDRRCLTDGCNYVWVTANDNGAAAFLARYAGSFARYIVKSIAEEFGIRIFSEYQPQYWGFESKEEWDAAWSEMARKDEDKYYDKLIKYLTDQGNDFEPDTVGMGMAEIARDLVAAQPNLLLPENRAKLLEDSERIYHEKHSLYVEFSPDFIHRLEETAKFFAAGPTGPDEGTPVQ